MTTKASEPSRGGLTNACRPRKRRLPLIKAMPKNVLLALDEALRALPHRSPAAVADVHKRFALLDKYEVTLRQTINHAKRLHAHGTAEDPPSHPPSDRGAAGSETVEAYRRRMNAIGEALSVVFAGMETPDSDLWGRGMYLKLVGRLYDVLDSEDLTLGDLKALSGMIYEQRRAHTHALEVERRIHAAHQNNADKGRDEVDPPTSRELPARLGDMVRQIYGVNLHEPAASISTATVRERH
ncbi:MAG: hypothetical protein KAV82_05665 [Phycisphaerae bacterium]|nr:hypothetical protein [Phycisphaerae bacterium]